MRTALLVALTAATTTPPASPIAAQVQDAARAIQSGRLDQARMMIATAQAAGAKGTQVDRLVADLAFASGNNADALAMYSEIHRALPRDATVCEQGVIAALKIDAIQQAQSLIDCATSNNRASWRAWNARGVLADWQSDWTAADAAYSKARVISPSQPEIVNNQGWSLLMRGNWIAARDSFRHAAELDPQSVRIANNVELVEAALSSDLPPRREGESAASWAARLNDAGIAAELRGDKKRAIAAFTQALVANGTWFSRASNNLEAAQKP